jgi:CheY-like chemotaxis protein
MDGVMQAGSAPHTRPRVLVIDDDPDVRTLIDLVLRSEGYDSTLVPHEATVLGGQDAQPDVVLCDPFPPPMLDFCLLERLDTMPVIRTVPLVLCTGAVHLVDDARTRLAHREVEVLLKPFDLDDLLTCIERVRAYHVGR